MRGFPGQTKVLLGGGAFSEVEVDQSLVGNRHFLRKRLEVGKRGLIESDGYRFLEQLGVGVGFGVGEFVVLSHGCTLWMYSLRSWRSALRAEMMRMVSPVAR